MMLRKGCPRCRGDLYLDRDGPPMLTCLQCGRAFAPAAARPAERTATVPVGAGDRERAA
jgi:ribosomal protein L37AE/L43A